MFYYSYLITNDNTSKIKPTTKDYAELYKHLPMQPGDIWGSDRYHIAEVNEYLVPTKFNIVLYALLPLSENTLPDELNFECGEIIYHNINPQEFDRIVETIRCFETRRNLYMMNRVSNGKAVSEYKNNAENFNVNNPTSSIRMLHKSASIVDAKPNYRVSESFLREFFGGTYDEYVNAKYIREQNGESLTRDDFSTDVNSKEEWNTKIINWINNNIYDLANIGFYASNFPDVIFFDDNFNDKTSLPIGRVHKVESSTTSYSKKISNIFNKFKKS